MSEIFTIVCENISVSAVQDILTAYAAATKKLQLLAVEIGVNGQTTVGNYPFSLVYLPATVTPGTGGASVTPRNTNPVGAAISATAQRNNTTLATTSGTASVWVASQLNPINGYYWTPPPSVQPGDEPKIELSGAVALRLGAVTGTLGISATMWLREV